MTRRFGPDRRTVLTLAPGLALGACATTASRAQGLRVVQRPGRVFKAVDLPREGTEAWFVVLIVESDAPLELQPLGVDIVLSAAGQEIRRERYGARAATQMAMRGLPAPAGVHWPIGFRIVQSVRAAFNVDHMQCVMTFADVGAVTADIALAPYTQQTALVFPFQGPGIVTQGGAANGGHRNTSGQFAIDAMALAPDYAVQTGTSFAVNTDLAGFGRPLRAPADGVVVHARGDRPDQPVPGVSDEAYHVPEHAGGGDPGNHLVIDHGNGEFSLVAHLMAGSLAVQAGDRVRQGQNIGRLGNSGDSFAPHVHVQLQDGPDWRVASGLPCRFGNIARERLVRGEFFVAD